MSFYGDRVYPHVVTMLGNPKPIQKIREQIVPLATGTVLEVGVGPGVNFPYYDPAKVSKVVRQNSARPNIVRVTMLQGSPHIIHFKRIFDFGEGQVTPEAETISATFDLKKLR